jgi:anti-sigma factor RsiW
MSKHLKEAEIIPYLDARLSDAERQRLDRHLTDCSACRTQLAEFRALLGVLEEWKAVEPSPAFDAAVRERLRAQPEPLPRWAWLRLRSAWGAALVVLVMVAIGLWQFTSLVPPQEQGSAPDRAQVEPTVVPDTVPETASAEGDSLELLDDPVLLENYELLAEFDVLFEPVRVDNKKDQL